MNKIITSFFLLMTFSLSAQVGIGTTTVNSSSELELFSSKQGLLVPRMTELQRLGIVAPAKGLLVFQINNASAFYYYNGLTWSTFAGGSVLDWSINGNGTTNPGTGIGENFVGTTDLNDFVFKTNNMESFRVSSSQGIGIGTTTPTAKLEIVGTYPVFRYADGLQAANFVLTSDALGNGFWLDSGALTITSDDDWNFTGGTTNSDTVYHLGQVVVGKNTLPTPSTTELDIDNGAPTGTQIGLGNTEYLEDGLSVTYVSHPFTSETFTYVVSNPPLVTTSFSGKLGYTDPVNGNLFRWNNVYAFTNVINTSDGTLKKDIKAMTYGIETVMKIKPISYYWKEEINGEHDLSINKELKLGFSAQELEKIIPEAVKSKDLVRKEENGPLTEIDMKYKGVYYEYLIPILVKAQQDQQKEIEALIEANKSLKKRLGYEN